MKRTKKQTSIKKELAECRKAWKPFTEWRGVCAWTLHHKVLIEPLMEPAANRIRYILSDKPESERAIRLRNFRPVRIPLPQPWAKASAELAKASAEWAKASAEWAKARAEWDKARAECGPELTRLHDMDWPDNTWAGASIFASTIFASSLK